MIAYRNERKFLCTSIADFVDRVQVIHDYREILWLDLEPRSAGAIFFADDVEVLQSFCKNNPDYHIVTSTDPHRLVNTFVPGHRFYHLAKGDRNPALILNLTLTSDFLLLVEDAHHQAPAVMNYVENSRQR